MVGGMPSSMGPGVGMYSQGGMPAGAPPGGMSPSLDVCACVCLHVACACVRVRVVFRGSAADRSGVFLAVDLMVVVAWQGR